MLKKLTAISFLLLVFSLPFANVPFPGLERYPLQITDLLFVAAAALFTAAVVFEDQKIRLSKYLLFLAAYVAAVLISLAFSVDTGKSAIKFAGIVYLVCLSGLSFNLSDGNEAIKNTVLAWLAAAAIASAYSLFVLLYFYIDRDSGLVAYGLSHYGTFPPGNYPRIRSFFSNPNMFGHYLAISWMLLLVAFRNQWLSRSLTYVTAALMLIAAAFTLSPAIGGIFFCSGLWILLIQAEKESVLSKAVGAALLIASLSFIAATVVKVDENFALSSEPSARILTWSSALENFAADPLTGKGVGTYAADASYGPQRLRDAHNIFLNVAAESGIFALIAILALAIWLVWKGMKLGTAGTRNSVLLGLSIAFAGGFFYQGLTGSFEDARHLWLLAGVLAGSVALSGEEERG